ncbi:MAG: hypothetical protein LBP52_08945 [Burkholderiaceae bacterium]|jgi:hypothetical protein|nr:hypothetical protein [Burkholderiaceae bacterium]
MKIMDFGWIALVILSVILSRIRLKRREKEIMKALPVFAPQHTFDHLSVGQARAMVDDAIAKGGILFVEPADKNISFPEQLGPAARELFSRYSVLETRTGFQLALAHIKISEYINGYATIGYAEDWGVVQVPYSDDVFFIEGGEVSMGIEIERFPSIYHLILDEIQQDHPSSTLETTSNTVPPSSRAMDAS